MLEGSTRKGGNPVRITAQLIDAVTGTHLWADRIDGFIEDVFELQDKVTTSVAASIEPKVRVAEIERALLKPTENLEAYDLVLRGRWAYGGQQRNPYEETAHLCRRAIALDPNYARAWASIALTHGDLIGHSDSDQQEHYQRGMEAIAKALAIDPNLPAA